MITIPEGVLSLLGTRLFSQVRPRYVAGGVLQVACPIYTSKYRSRVVKRSYWEEVEEFTVKVFHRMKIDLGRGRWWCPACRKGGALTALKARITRAAENEEE